MAYTTPSKIKEVMRKLPNSFPDSSIEFHIGKSEAYIDSKLGEVFDTPFDPVPKIIEHIAIDLAVFFLAEDLYSSNKPNLDEYHQERYDRAMKLLKDIASGDLTIGVTPKSESGFATTNNHDPIFTLEEPWW